jgi:hypothetical protein
MLTAAATTNKIISNCQYGRFTTLVNSASMALPIGLLPKMAKFCHTLNILFVGHRCRRALLDLYSNTSAAGWSVDGQHTTIRVTGL